MLRRLAVLSLMGVSLVSAKSYTINLADNCTAGTTQLKAGEYVLKLDGQKAVLFDHAGNSFDLPAKIQTADQKYNETMIDTAKVNGSSRIEWIKLGGSKEELIFK